MSLGSDFISGFEATTSAREKKKARAQQAKLDEARRALELDMQAKNIAAQKSLQDSALAADAAKQFRAQGHDFGMLERTQGFQGGQADKDRNFRTNERVGAQGFQSSESAKDRELRERATAAQLFMDAQRLNQAQEQFGKKFEWDKDPANPSNKYQEQHAAYLKGNTMDAPPELPDAATALKNGQKGADLPTLTPEQAMAAKPGTRYRTVDGRVLIR